MAISITGNNQAALSQTTTHFGDRGLYTLARLLFPQLTFFLVPRYFPQVMSLTKKYQMARRTLAMADTIVVMTYEMREWKVESVWYEVKWSDGRRAHVDDGHEDGVDTSSDAADDVTHCD